tara:strand:+ start:1044 stop:1346 length:303 start_codon:yes stop_codon:yes gene_type:complete
MLFWIIYLVSSLLIAFYSSSNFPERIKPYCFITILSLFLTPAYIDSSSDKLAPALFIFSYDLILQQFFSLRSLRPLVFSLPLILISLLLFKRLKKIFFQG